MKSIVFTATFAIILTACANSLEAQGNLIPVNLRCEDRVNPVGIGNPTPALSWQVQSTGTAYRGQKQTAYEIQVGTTPGGSDLWDSGKVGGSRTVGIVYGGQTLTSVEKCYWQMRVYDGNGNVSSWSSAAQWTMGLLTSTNWTAQWIGYDKMYTDLSSSLTTTNPALFNISGLSWITYSGQTSQGGSNEFALRKQVVIPAGQITKAVFVLYTSGICNVYVNGQEMTNSAMRWEATAQINVAPWLNAGANELALDTSDCYGVSVVGQLVVQFANGSVTNIPVDTTWKAASWPSGNWTQSNYNDSGWATPTSGGSPWGSPALGDIPRVPAAYLRKQFTVAKTVTRATAYVTALGAYELHLNGQKVGNDVMTPGWSEFSKRVFYQAYDVTGMLQTGANTIGAILGDGWYASVPGGLGRRLYYGGRPRFLAQLVIQFSDGSTQTVVSDESWEASYGPILYGDLYIGSGYDARLEMPGWDTANFNAAAWSPVVTGSVASGIQVQAAVTEQPQEMQTLPAISITNWGPGDYTFDLGQNIAGWVQLNISGHVGDRITIRHSEVLDQNGDGRVAMVNLGGAQAADYYTFATNGTVTFQPRFTYHGFRYVELRGLSMPPTINSVTGIAVYAAMPRTGNFQCSDSQVNQLYSNQSWTQKGNYMAIPSAVPERDERLGWTGDAELFVPVGVYNFDVQNFFSQWLVTLCQDSQGSDGSYPNVAPDLGDGEGPAAWGDAGWICPYNLYRTYGDTKVIVDNYASFKAYGQYLANSANNYVRTAGGWGDWGNVGGGASITVIDTAYYAYYAQAMSEMAAAIGNSADASAYATLHNNIVAAFANFFNADGTFTDGSSQCGYALAFAFNLVPPALKSQVAQQFANSIAAFNDHPATGFVGSAQLLQGLHAAGRDDLFYAILLQQTFPSWLWQVNPANQPNQTGTTTMCEWWPAYLNSSLDAQATAGFAQSLYSIIGGISPISPGYNTILIQPVPGDGITWANTSFDSDNGLISTAWTNTGSQFNLNLVIPPNTTAQVYVPTTNVTAITESGRPAATSPGVTYVGISNGAAIYSVGSGNYLWSSPFISASAGSGNVVITTRNQYGSSLPFTPSWGVQTSGDLILGQAPSSSAGNFDEVGIAGSVNSLTSGGNLTISQITTSQGGTTSSNYLTCGNGQGYDGSYAGSSVVYTLNGAGGGYTLTNITVDGGWVNNGRDGQAYTIYYATATAPTTFILLTNVNYTPANVPGGVPSATQVTITSAAGALASGVVAVEFNFANPPSENGWCGYAQIAVYGTPTPIPSLPVDTTNQYGSVLPFTPSWGVQTSGDLILGQTPSSSAGNFGEVGTAGSVNSLTSGGNLTISALTTTQGGTTSSNYLTCGNGQGYDGSYAGSSVIYTLNGPINGYTLTNITVYGGWQDNGRDAQDYTIYYATATALTTFIPLTSVSYTPANVPGGVPSATRVTIASAAGTLATNVVALEFNFANPPSENGWCGYAQIAVYGTPSPVPAPTGLTAVAGPAEVYLSWNAVSGATSYNVERSTNSGGETTITNIAANSYRDYGVTAGTTNYYKVSAVTSYGTSAGTSPNSSEVSGVPQPASFFSFVVPSLGVGSYVYNPGGGTWIFIGNSGMVANNSSAWGNPNVPDAQDGGQAGFVQWTGSFWQTISGFVPGTNYTVTFCAAERPGNSQTWNVEIDGNVIAANPGSGAASYTEYAATFTASAPEHTLSFVGTDLNTGDNTIFISNVRISPTLSSAILDDTGSGGQVTYTDGNGLNPVSSPPYTNGYVVHTFTASGTLSIPGSVSANVLMVGGGGGAGNYGDGGGAGGLIYTNLSLSNGTYSVVVGAGGSGTIGNTNGANGTSSVFNALIALGGGAGGSGYPGSVPGRNGGSGGGGGGNVLPASSGSGLQSGSSSGGYGNNGYSGGSNIYGGGGGAGAAGSGTVGGNGLAYAISGVTNYYGGGGGGVAYNGSGAGGLGGGGNGGSANVAGGNGTANTGGGGGGGWAATGGSGGSGIVIVRYPYAVTSPQVANFTLNGGGIHVSGTTLTLAAVNGTPNGTWTLLQSTNLLLPMSQWTTNTTGTYETNGSMSANILNIITNSQNFFRLK